MAVVARNALGYSVALPHSWELSPQTVVVYSPLFAPGHRRLFNSACGAGILWWLLWHDFAESKHCHNSACGIVVVVTLTRFCSVKHCHNANESSSHNSAVSFIDHTAEIHRYFILIIFVIDILMAKLRYRIASLILLHHSEASAHIHNSARVIKAPR